jgi:signal transduction histidine kinase/CheY-like chemotaxis protein
MRKPNSAKRIATTIVRVLSMGVAIAAIMSLVHVAWHGGGAFLARPAWFAAVHLSLGMLAALLASGMAIRVLRTDAPTPKDSDSGQTPADREAHAQQSQIQKLEAIGRLAGGVAHDINNVLTSVMSVAAAVKLDLEEHAGASVSAEDMNDILEACRRGRDLTHSLLGFARKGDLYKHAMSLADALNDVHKLLERVAPKTIAIQVEMAPDVSQILGDASQIKNVLMNLCINGIDAMKDAGQLRLRLFDTVLDADQAGLPPGKYAAVVVQDTGEGMSEAVVARAFDPFFTTKPEGMGTGLGLSRAWGTVKEHGGGIDIASEVGRGTTVTVYFPALGLMEHDPNIRRSISPVSSTEAATILLVDDEELVRKTTRRLLERFGYRVLVADNGQEGVSVYAERQREIDLVLLDMMMPVMDGATAFRNLRAMNPAVPVVFCSGYSRDETAGELLREPLVGFVQKPFSPGELTHQLQHLLRDANNG